MPARITAPRGTRDLLPEESPRWEQVEADGARPGPPLRLPTHRDAALRARRALRARASARAATRSRRRCSASAGRAAARRSAPNGRSARSRRPGSCARTSSTGCTCGPGPCDSRPSDRCSATTARRPAATASSRSGTSRSSATRGRRSTPSSSSSRIGSIATSAWPMSSRASTRSVTRPAVPPTARR